MGVVVRGFGGKLQQHSQEETRRGARAGGVSSGSSTNRVSSDGLLSLAAVPYGIGSDTAGVVVVPLLASPDAGGAAGAPDEVPSWHGPPTYSSFDE